MQHRIVCPILFQLFDGQAFEQFFFPLEVGFHGRDQEAFSETAGAAQEIVFAGGGESVNQIGLVHIKEVSLADAFKILDSNRIKHGGKSFVFGCLLAAVKGSESRAQRQAIFDSSQRYE